MSSLVPTSNDRHVPEEYEGTIEPNWYCRGWNSKREKYCKARAGAGTEHLGRGRCKHHAGNAPIKHGRYSTILRTPIGEAMERHMEDPDPLDIVPELSMMRALLERFINRNAGKDDDLDIQAAAGLIDTVSKIVSRVQKSMSDYAVSRKDFYRVLEEMGRVVDLRVPDEDLAARIKDDWLNIRLR